MAPIANRSSSGRWWNLFPVPPEDHRCEGGSSVPDTQTDKSRAQAAATKQAVEFGAFGMVLLMRVMRPLHAFVGHCHYSLTQGHAHETEQDVLNEAEASAR